MRALIKIGGRCDSRCRFCHAGGSARSGDLSTREVCRRVLAARDGGCRAVVLSGGEPTIREDLPTLFRFIRRAGLGLGLVSNGRRLAEPALRAELLDHGLEYVQISLHGSRPEVHDGLCRVRSFDQAVAAIAGLAEVTGVELGVTTVACRPNLGDLEATVALVSHLLAGRAEPGTGARPPRHRLALLEPKGLAAADRDLWPPLPEAAAAISRALEVGRRLDGGAVRRGYDGLPLCLAPDPPAPVEDLRAHGIGLVQEVDEAHSYPADAGRRAYGEPCRSCELRPRCSGVYQGYFPLSEELLEVMVRRGSTENGADEDRRD